MQAYGNTIFYIILILFLYLIVLVPQKKARKDMQELQKEVKVDDTITTHSGIIGKIIEINEDTITIVTGPDEIKLDVQRWSIVEKKWMKFSFIFLFF